MTTYLADLDGIPTGYRDQVRRYVEHGALPRSRALKALLAGRTFDAIEHMDSGDLTDIVHFIQKYLPSFAWGSPEAIARWEYVGGLETRIRRERREQVA